MALTDPKLAYRTIRDAILTLLRDNKATLNENLVLGTFQREQEQIKSGDIVILPTNNAIYPTILIKVARKDEDFNYLGRTGRKHPVITFRVYVIVKNVLNAKSESDNEIMQVVSNMEAIFRDNIDIDGSVVLWGQVTSVEYGTTEVFENQYFDIAICDYVCVVELK